MRRLAHQAYLRTRLAIMSENLLGREKLQQLAKMPLDELAKSTGFDTFKDKDRVARLASFERALMQTWLDELSALLRPLEGPARRRPGLPRPVPPLHCRLPGAVQRQWAHRPFWPGNSCARCWWPRSNWPPAWRQG